jgi:hypothetical protein
MKEEQKLETRTQLYFDFIDVIKILFGAIPEVEVIISVPPGKEEITHFNATSKINLLRKSKSHFSKNKPDYGYTLEAEPKGT